MSLMALIVTLAAGPAATGMLSVDASAYPRIIVHGPNEGPGTPEGLFEAGRPVTASRLTSADTLSLAIVVDSSASVTEETLGRIRRGLEVAGAILEGTTQFALLDADINVRQICPWTPAAEELSVALEQIHADGGEAVGRGLVEAIAFAATAPHPRAALLITNGCHGTDELISPDIIGLAQQLGVPLQAVGIGVDLDFAQLRAAAEHTGGEAWFIAHGSDPLRTFERLADSLLKRGAYAYTSLSPVPDGSWCTVEWRGVSTHKTRYHVPPVSAGAGWVDVAAIGVDGDLRPVLFVAESLAGGEPAYSVTGALPLALPAGDVRITLDVPGRPAQVIRVTPGETTQARVAVEGRVVFTGDEALPEPLVLRRHGERTALWAGATQGAVDLVPGTYDLDIGFTGRVVHQTVEVIAGRPTEVAIPARSGYELTLTDADGAPVGLGVFLKDPQARTTLYAGRTGAPLMAPAGRYLVDFAWPHTGALREVTLLPGEITREEAGPLARLKVTCIGAEGFVSPPIFLQPLEGRRSFSLGRSGSVDLAPGAYVVTVSSVPPVTQTVALTPGQKLPLTLRAFGALTVRGPEGERFRLLRASDGAWVGVFPYNEPLHVVAGAYHVLPRVARAGETSFEVVVEACEHTETQSAEESVR